MAKRVQIPGYELARNLVGQQNLPEVLPASLGQGCYLQSEISELIRRAMNGSKLGPETGLETASHRVTRRRA